MKFSWKIFFTSFLIILLSFGIGGFALVNSVFTSSLSSQMDSARDTNRYVASSFYAVCNESNETSDSQYYYINYMADSFSRQLSSGNSDTAVSIGTVDMVKPLEKSGVQLSGLKSNTRTYSIVPDNKKFYIQVVSQLFISGQNYYVLTQTDITEIYRNRDSYIQYYQIILICVALSASLVLFAISRFLTRPLVRLSEISVQIAEGDFSKRAEASSTKEIYELSESFNTMAQNVEDYIAELKESAQSRDDFVADFTHELKTPLTSVIGYADLLRTYELDAKKRRECAEYIYKEGKRLETLSVNLLNIIVLKKNDVKLDPLKTGKLFKEVGNSVEFLLNKYKVKLDVNFESAEILAEQSLLKTLLYNIIDNACKASNTGQTVSLEGYVCEGKYKIKVIDRGRGIPNNQLKKITRPFYMVDKSRSRSMGGAGLGLALCIEIARLHGSELVIESELGKGTCVEFEIPLKGETESEN